MYIKFFGHSPNMEWLLFWDVFVHSGGVVTQIKNSICIFVDVVAGYFFVKCFSQSTIFFSSFCIIKRDHILTKSKRDDFPHMGIGGLTRILCK